MKSQSALLLAALIMVVAHCTYEDITLDHLPDIKVSRKIWLVYTPADANDANIRILHDVSVVLSGFFKVGVLPTSGAPQLLLYGDDGATTEYSGNFNVDDIVEFALASTEAVAKARSKVADEAKAFNDFKAKEAERIKKEWEDEQALRLKSNTLIITPDNFQSAFLSQRDPFLINFYESNCSACIELNREWQAVANELKGRAKVAKVNITHSHELEESFKFEQYPVIRFYPAGIKDLSKFSEFAGIRKKFSILEWSNARLAEKKSTAELSEFNQENYVKLCKSTKATCVVFFVEDVDAVSDKVGQLAAKYLKKPLTFFISQKGSQPVFESRVGIDRAPQVLMVYLKGKKYLHLKELDFRAVEDTLEEISMGNRIGFEQFSIANPFE